MRRQHIRAVSNHFEQFTSPPSSETIDSQKIALNAIDAALDQKALDVRGIRISEMSDVADYFVIVSGTSERHVKGIADKVQEKLKTLGESPSSLQGYENGEWVILDYGSVVVHVFYEPARQYYSFDELWRRGSELSLPQELEQQVRKLRTGIYPPPKRAQDNDDESAE